MKIVGVVVITLIAGFVAFQNCQQAPHPDDLSKSAASVNSSKVDLQGQKVSEVSFNILENEIVARNSGSYEVAVNKTIKISLPSGQIVVSSDLDSQQNHYCLTETLTNEITQIIKMSQVCKNPDPPAGQLCAMVVRLPYAEITTEKETFSLGGASDGCGSNGFDLCEEQAAILKGFMATLKTNYKSYACP